MDKDLAKAQNELSAESATTAVIKQEVTELSLMSVAKVKARLKAYENVYANYQKFIEAVAEELAEGKFKENTYKEISVARLVASYVVDTEAFLKEHEEYLRGVEKQVRSKFVEDTLKGFPDDIREMLLAKLRDKKHEVLEWFAKELQLAQKIATEREEENG